MEEKNYTYKYPRPAVTTDCVTFGVDGHKLKVLLIERGHEPYKGFWAFPGGFLNMNENAEEGALRELEEETGLTLSKIKELGTFSEVERDPRERVISIAFYALTKKAEVKGNDDAVKAQWFSIDKVPNLAFDHNLMLQKALQKLNEDLKKTSNPQPIGFSGILLAKRQNSFYCTYFLHNRNVADTKSPYPIKRLEVIRWFNQKSMVFNQSLS